MYFLERKKDLNHFQARPGRGELESETRTRRDDRKGERGLTTLDFRKPL